MTKDVEKFFAEIPSRNQAKDVEKLFARIPRYSECQLCWHKKTRNASPHCRRCLSILKTLAPLPSGENQYWQCVSCYKPQETYMSRRSKLCLACDQKNRKGRKRGRYGKRVRKKTLHKSKNLCILCDDRLSYSSRGYCRPCKETAQKIAKKLDGSHRYWQCTTCYAPQDHYKHRLNKECMSCRRETRKKEFQASRLQRILTNKVIHRQKQKKPTPIPAIETAVNTNIDFRTMLRVAREVKPLSKQSTVSCEKPALNAAQQIKEWRAKYQALLKTKDSYDIDALEL